MQIHVGLITWGPDHGDEDEFITAATSLETVQLALAEHLIHARKEAAGLFGYWTDGLGGDMDEGGNDDLDEFYADEVIADMHRKGVDIDTAEAYLDAFREATTAPWWSIQEVELGA